MDQEEIIKLYNELNRLNIPLAGRDTIISAFSLIYLADAIKDVAASINRAADFYAKLR